MDWFRAAGPAADFPALQRREPGQAWGTLYPAHFLLWCGASFTAYRVLMSWAYSRTGSLLLLQLMHAGFTGGQGLLAPTIAPTASGILWYGVFAAVLWAAVVVVAAQDNLLVRRSLPQRVGADYPAAGCWSGARQPCWGEHSN